MRAAHRVLGSVLGVGVFGVLSAMRLHGLALVGTLAFLQFVAEVVVVRNYGLALVFLTPIALLISANHGGNTSALVDDRLVDTLVGSVFALAVFALAERFWRDEPLAPER